MAKLRSRRKSKSPNKSRKVFSRTKSKSGRKYINSRNKSRRKQKDGNISEKLVNVRLISQDNSVILNVNINIEEYNTFNQFFTAIITKFDNIYGLELTSNINIIAISYQPPLIVTYQNFQQIKHDILAEQIGPFFIIRDIF